VIVNWISAGVLIVVLILCFRRIAIKWQLDRLKLPRNLPLSFQRKLDYVKQMEQSRHVSALLFLSLLLGIGLSLTTYSVFRMNDQMVLLGEQNNELKDRIYKVEKEQKKIATKLPIKAYPSNGVGLSGYSWEELFSDENREKQYEIENDLSEKVSPYFGLSTTLIVLDIPTQTLNIALAGDSGSEENRKQIKENIKAFAKEAKNVEKLTQITFQMNLMNDKNKQKVYSCTFSRENANEDFKLIQEDE
jgi:anthranilate/para-aminobenzoate synthase component I